MKIKSNQTFTGFDFLMLLGTFVVVAVITTPIVKSSWKAYDVPKVQFETEAIAKELLHTNFKTTASGASRGLASVENSGSQTLSKLDPWGKPYHFKVTRNSLNQPTYIIVWSSGPNGLDESSDVEVHVSSSGAPRVSFKNDDQGSALPIR